VFAVEGPMADERPWKEAATFARTIAGLPGKNVA